MIAVADPVRLREPGLAPREPGVERYRVPGGGVLVLRLAAGDELVVTDVEGRQPAELVAFDASGKPGVGLLQERADASADALHGLLAANSETGRHLRSIVQRAGLQTAGARAVRLFDKDSAPGEQRRFTVDGAGTGLVLVPGGRMAIDQQDPASELRVRVRRAVVEAAPPPCLPEPLAEPILDLRVHRATAAAYEVKAGDYIQVIDVEGRQCSDFLAFQRARLDAGVERGLDPTTTRTLMGAAYPGPGLYSKFFDQDMQPLVEVVRDTCGRHDTFGLACTAKYYEDRGYFGHANCSDNFNGVLRPYAIAERKGWPAINFFFNTRIDQDNILHLDEPWSRPGDYVLMRALADLVCASSACPDDIDAANAWNPTDVQVRVYPEKNVFSKAVAFRRTPDAEPRMTQETGFHPRTSALTRHFTEYRGYWLPTTYNGHGAIEQYHACRERAAIMDLSPLRKFEVLGPDAEALLQYTLTRNVRKLSVGQVVYSAMCYESGGMLDDGTLLRLGADNFRWICGDEYAGEWLREQAARQGHRVWIKTSTDHIHNVAVQGPASRALLDTVVWTPPTQPTLAELGWFRFTIGRIGDYQGIPIMVSRTGYTGELGYEVWCHPSDASAVWDAIWTAGEAHGLLPLGLDALDMLRIEAGLVFAGYEFCDQTDPFEAGIGFTVPLKTKTDDFIGRDALLERQAHPQRALVGLELAGNEPAAHGDCVHAGRSQVGTITSATRSPVLSKNIALCRLDVRYADLGTQVEVGKLDGHQKRLPASVVRFPFYDPDKTRVRA